MRTTFKINDTLYTMLKHQAFDSGVTVSQIVEEAVKYQILEDLEDIDDANRRVGESSLSFEKVAKQLEEDGLL